MKKACYAGAHDSFVKRNFTLSVIFHSSICEIPCFSGTNMCLKVFSPKFRSIPSAIPLLIFSLLGLLAVFVKKFGDLVFTSNTNSTPGIVKSRACASLF